MSDLIMEANQESPEWLEKIAHDAQSGGFRSRGGHRGRLVVYMTESGFN